MTLYKHFYNSNSFLQECLRKSLWNLTTNGQKYRVVIMLKEFKLFEPYPRKDGARETDRTQIWPKSMSSVKTNASWKHTQKPCALMTPASQRVGNSSREEKSGVFSAPLKRLVKGKWIKSVWHAAWKHESSLSFSQRIWRFLNVPQMLLSSSAFSIVLEDKSR